MVTTPWIAIVDDEAAVCAALARVLRIAGYEVVTFSSGAEFLEALEARRPACAVLDVSMPGVGGFAVQQKLRAMSVPVPAILITASDDPGLADAAAAAGAALLRKPFASATLIEAIEAALHG